MEPFFSEFHAAAASQLNGKPCQLRQSADSFDGWMALGKSLSHELRYLEAIEAYSQAILLEPNRMDALRQRGGKYLATLQPEKAMADFERCRMLVLCRCLRHGHPGILLLLGGLRRRAGHRGNLLEHDCVLAQRERSQSAAKLP